MSERPEHDPHLWPEPCRASLLAQLAATTEADRKVNERRLLKGDDA